MDPISILSVAAAVVAFVDFGGKMLSSTWYHLRRDDDMTIPLEDLAREAGQLGRLSRQILSTRGRPGSPEGQNLEFDAVLAELAKEAAQVSEDVESLITTLQTANEKRKNQSLRLHLIKAAKDGGSEYSANEKKMQAAEDRLRGIKTDMMSAVLACLWADSKLIVEEINRISRELSKEHTRCKAPATSLPKSEPPMTTEEVQRQQRIQQIWASLEGGTEVESTDLRLSPVSQVEIQRAILCSLQPNKTEDRKEGISEAHEKTFRWIFRRPQDTGNEIADTPPWSNFVSWLENDQTSQIYWITGKPGSGKSTLMKYIVESERLTHHLKEWSKGASPRIAVFYSWNAGGDNQRTEKGLLKSVLYQYLSQMPGFIAGVCPRRWAMHRVFGTKGVGLPSWTRTELQQAFDILLPLAHQSDQKLALFIDGLDEFQVADNFRYLLTFIETVQSKGGAKICTSSREWTPFTDHFHRRPSLRLQDLTRNDIQQYIYDHLSNSIAYSELKTSNTEDVDRLLESLLSKASGVFLWVRIVTDVVLAGMEAGQTVKELHASVEQLPPDLSDLYQGIWESLDPKDQTSVARLLRIVEASVGPLDPTTMFAAEQPDPVEALKMSQDALEKLVTRRLRSQTRGLIEISESRTINYLHRTARDWSLTVEETMQNMLPPNFDANLQLLLAKVAMLTILQPRDFLPSAIRTTLSPVQPQGPPPPTFAQLWDRIGACLEYASRVIVQNSQSENAGKLYAMLDSLDTWVESNQDAFHQLWGWRNHRGFRKDAGGVHWASYQFSPDPPSSAPPSNSFLGLASQYAILPYVEKLLGEYPKLGKSKQYNVSLLENALFIPGSSPSRLLAREESRRLWQPRFRQREALIRLLLAHGADPRAESVLLCRFPGLVNSLSLTSRGRHFGGATQTLPLYKTIPSFYSIGGKAFWGKVQSMFDDNLKSRGTMSRLRSILSP